MARRKGLDINGVILLDKPEGMSSNFALQQVRRLLNAKKAGHTGTLDPFATGLLVCCFGMATKIANQMLNADKSYVAELALGTETDSGDLTGQQVQAAQTVPAYSDSQIEAVLEQFRGDIQQVPPMHSALKHEGRPLYDYARQGIDIKREPRTVRIHRLDCLEHVGNTLTLSVDCSKGTYIRTLAQDIGRALGCFAHLSALRRTAAQPFSLAEAKTLDALKGSDDPSRCLIPLNQLPRNLLTEKLLKRISTDEPSAS